MSEGRVIGYAPCLQGRSGSESPTGRTAAARRRGTSHLHGQTVRRAKSARPGPDVCLNVLKPGDTLAVWRLDRLGRSMRHLVTLIVDLRERSVSFRSISDGMIDTTSGSGELIFHIFSALAQFERRLIQERTRAEFAAARARGRKGGRPRLLASDPKLRLAKKLYADKLLSIDDTCQKLKISRSTYYRDAARQ